MSSASPPKPWERAAAAGAMPSSTMSSAPTATAATSSDPSGGAPTLPSRPATLTSAATPGASNLSALNANRFGSSPYGYGGYNSYSSPYSRFGGGYGSMYGGMSGMSGMSGMGGMYGGGMGGYGSMGGMYGGGMGMPGNPNDPSSLTQSFSNSTQATFQMIESIVGAFGGFAQMLESTYMATYSSFFAMVSVAEQFGNLRQTLGSVLGIYTIMRWMRTTVAKLTGRPLPASSKELTPSNFAAFTGRAPDGSPAPARPSKKPFIMFIVAVFGLPYLMGKLIRALARSQEQEERRRLEANPQAVGADQPLDINKLEFCKVLYDFTPETNTGAVQGVDLPVKKGDLVAVLSKTDPLGNPSEWWHCRARNGQTGYLPSPYLETIQRRPVPAQITAGSQPVSPVGSRAQTMTATVSDPGSRAQTMTDAKVAVPAKVPAPPQISGKVGDIAVESFQKGQFYS